MKRLIAFAFAAAAAAYLAAAPAMADGGGPNCCKKPLRADGMVPIRKPLRADGMVPIRKPLVQAVADVQPNYNPKFDRQAEPEAAPVQVLRVYFLAVAYNTQTGEIIGGITAKFPDMETCLAVKNAPVGEFVPPPPHGHSLYLECKTPSDVST